MNYDGVYIKGKLNGQDIYYTADTGATRTVVSERAYLKIPKDQQPKLDEYKPNIAGAGGKVIKKLGKGYFDLELGPLQLRREVLVAAIEDDVLLGMDILQNEESGSADILLSEGIINFMGKSIPCVQVGLPDSSRQVQVVEDVVVPPFSETVLQVMVERTEDESFESQDFVIEPSPHFSEKSGLAMATTLVNIERRVTVPVRVRNPFSHEITIPRDSVVGTAEVGIAGSDPLFEIEDEAEARKFYTC